MTYKAMSWAAVASTATQQDRRQATTPTALSGRAMLDEPRQVTSQSSPIPPASPRRVAFISGHLDITPAQFAEHYHPALDAAIHRGDAFVLSDCAGVDTLALTYLRSRHVDPSRITIYFSAPRPNRRPGHNQSRSGGGDPRATAEQRFKKEGYNTATVTGYHTERDRSEERRVGKECPV